MPVLNVGTNIVSHAIANFIFAIYVALLDVVGVFPNVRFPCPAVVLHAMNVGVNDPQKIVLTAFIPHNDFNIIFLFI